MPAKNVFLAGLLWFLGLICIRVFRALAKTTKPTLALDIVATLAASLRLIVATRHAPKIETHDLFLFVIIVVMALLGLPWLSYMTTNTAEKTISQSVTDLTFLPGGSGPVDTAFKLCVAYAFCAYLVFTT